MHRDNFRFTDPGENFEEQTIGSNTADTNQDPLPPICSGEGAGRQPRALRRQNG